MKIFKIIFSWKAFRSSLTRSDKPTWKSLPWGLAFTVPEGTMQTSIQMKEATNSPTRYNTYEAQQWPAWHNNPNYLLVILIAWQYIPVLLVDLKSKQEENYA